MSASLWTKEEGEKKMEKLGTHCIQARRHTQWEMVEGGRARLPMQCMISVQRPLCMHLYLYVGCVEI